MGVGLDRPISEKKEDKNKINEREVGWKISIGAANSW